MSELKPMLRRGAVVAWLVEEGLTASAVRALFESGVIVAVYPRKGGRAWYHRDQVQRDVVEELREKKE